MIQGSHIKEIDRREAARAGTVSLNEKVDELVKLIQTTSVDEEQANDVKTRISTALENSGRESIKAFKTLDTKKDASREELLDDLDALFSSYTIDSKASKKYILQKRFKSVVTVCISLLLIMMGFAMIIMPAPPYFEMFTIFYFNANDGVTLMDLIALLIVFSGIYLFIVSLLRARETL